MGNSKDGKLGIESVASVIQNVEQPYKIKGGFFEEKTET